MNLTDLSKTLLSDTQLAHSESGFFDAYAGFLALIRRLSGAAIYFHAQDSYAYVANTAFLLQRLLAEEADFKGEICLVYDRHDAKLCQKIRRYVPFFENGPFTYAASAKEIRQPLVLSGGADQDDVFWQQLGRDVRYIFTIRPYLDDTDLSFFKIRTGQGDWITYYTDAVSLDQCFAERNYFIDIAKIRTMTDEKKAYWHRLYDRLDLAEAILNSSGAVLLTADGTASLSATGSAEHVILMLALALLTDLKKNKKTYILAVTDTASVSDNAFSLLRLFCDIAKGPDELQKELQMLYPSAAEEDLKTGLLQPLLKKREDLKTVLDHVRFADTPAAFNESRLYVCATGELPYDYLAALFAKSSFLFFESCDHTNLAVNLGIPYMQAAVETSLICYPSQLSPTEAVCMSQMCEQFKHDITAYTTAADKTLAAQIDAVCAFIQNPHPEYFAAVSNFAQGRKNKTAPVSLIHDKLAAAGSIFYTMHEELYHKSYGHTLYPKNNMTFSDIGKLYSALLEALDETQNTLCLSAVLSGMRAGDYLKELAGGHVFSLSLQSAEDILLDDSEDETLKSILIRGRSNSSPLLEGADLEIRFLYSFGADSLEMQVHGAYEEKGVLAGIPWLPFEEAGFDLTVPENNRSICGSISGVFGRTDTFFGVNLCLNLNTQDDVMMLMANLKEPLTALDAFGAIAGGIDFMSLLPQQLRPAVSLGLSELAFSYSRRERQISAMSFSFENTSQNPWVLWEKDGKRLLTARPLVSISVLSPADLSRKQTYVSIGAFVDIGEPESADEIGQLWLEASCPPFTAQMRMASEKISLPKLLALFGCSFDDSLDITQLCIFADFDSHIYQLSAAVGGEWKLADQFAVTGIGLSLLDRSGKLSVSFAGSMKIFETIQIAAAIAYSQGSWNLAAKAALAESGQDITMSDLIQNYCPGNECLALNETDNPLAAELSFSLTKSSGKTDFEVQALVDQWDISLFEGEKSVSASGAVGRKNGAFYAYLAADINLLGADMQIRLNYGTSSSFQLIWGSFSGTAERVHNETVASIAVSGLSIGHMVETLTGWLYGSGFSLDAPWDALDHITLDFQLTYHFTKKAFTISIGEHIDIGICSINGLDITYDPSAKQKIALQLSVRFAWDTGNVQQLSWDAAEPGSAPAPAGTGSSRFDLRYLALGQKLLFFPQGYQPAHTQEAIAYLEEHTTPEEFPVYDAGTGMLAAAELGILKENGTYFIDASLVFYDPALYAFAIRLDGAAAKVFAGFSFEIIYAKLTETLGVFKSTVVLPERFRRLDLGIFSVTLPDFYIEIYTNGDFKVDLGFPKNGDFSRSFTLSGIVPPGLPLTGSAGLYFGRLSSASAASSNVHLPKTGKGIFDPAIVFGLGIRLGVGKSISYGILSGGFSLTAAVILEGVIAKWIPYNSQAGQPWYYHLEGVVSLTANIYGCIDFAIITASVNLTVSTTASFIYETCRAVILTVSAYVEASASLRINFGIFKIHISFHFKVQVKESFQLGHDSIAPWDENILAADRQRLFLFAAAPPSAMEFANLTPETPVRITGNIALSVTAAADEYGSGKPHVLANLIMTVQEGDAFQQLAVTLIYWVIAAAYGKKTVKEDLDSFPVSDDYLAAIEAYFDSEKMPVAIADAQAFLERFFEISVQTHEEAYAGLRANESAAGVFFPIPPQTEVTVSYGGQEYSRYALEEYNILSDGAIDTFKEMFHKLAVTAENETTHNGSRKNKNPMHGLSVSEFVFCDWFCMAAKHAIRSMRLLLKNKGLDACRLNDMLSQLQEQNFYTELSGILSRYFLHGLRLPTVTTDSKGTHSLIFPQKPGLWVRQADGALTLPKEAGIFALTGQAFEVYGAAGASALLKLTLMSNCPYLHLPDQFALEISDTDGSAQAAGKIMLSAPSFTVSYDLPEIEAEWIPAVFTFASPIHASDQTIWTVPDSLYAYFTGNYTVYPCFDYYMAMQGSEFSRRKINVTPLSLIEFSVTKTAEKGVYIIGTAAAGDISILEMLIHKKPDIQKLQLLTQTNTDSGADAFLSVSQLSLSTDSRPPESAQNSQYLQTLQLLWKAFVTNNGGYVLTYRDALGTVLGDKAVLAIFYGFSTDQADTCLPLVNAVAGEAPAAGESLAAFAKMYCCHIDLTSGQAQTSSCIPPEKLIPEQIAASCCSNIRAIAKYNGAAILDEHTQWNFYDIIKQDAGQASVTSFTAYPNKGETLAAYAARNGTTPARALWMNREKACLFRPGQTLCIPVQAGFYADAGNENTDSLVNERYLVTRGLLPDIPAPDSGAYAANVLENNYSLLCYSVKGQNGYSSPVSYRQSGEKLQYDQAVPVDRLMGGNYRSCGKLAQTCFMWLDYYGNRLGDPFFTARLAGYQDALSGLSKWQSISCQWQPKPGKNTVIQVILRFSTDGFEEEGAKNSAFLFYIRLRKQIADEGLNICLSCSMFEQRSDTLDKQPVFDMIDSILSYLQTGNIPQTEFVFEFSFAESPVTQLLLVPLESCFIMERKGSCGYGYEEVNDLTHVQSPVGLPADLCAFDRMFRSSFQEYIALKSGGNPPVYAYKVSSLHIRTELTNEMVYAPAPFSTECISCDSIMVRPYANGAFGDAEEKSCRFADVNIWMKHALHILDSILSADIVSAASLAACSHDSLLAAKATIAAKLSGMLCPVFANTCSNKNKQPPKEASEAFRQTLLTSVSAYFKVKAVLAFQADVEGVPENAVLYGGFDESPDNQNSGPLVYSSLRLKNGRSQTAAFMACGQEVVLDNRNGAVLPGIEIKDGLHWKATHLESNITPVIDGFHASDWHGRLSEDITEHDLCNANTLKIPFPLYTYPELPKMVSQEAIQAKDPYQWIYAFTYSRSFHYPQQAVRCQVRYNVSRNLLKNEANAFVSALAQTDAAAEAVLEDLQLLAGQIHANTDVLPDHTLAERFKAAFACAQAMYTNLAAADFGAGMHSDSLNSSTDQIEFTVTEKQYKNGLFCICFDYDGIEPYLEGYTAEQAEKNTWIFWDEKGYLSYANGQSIHSRKILMPGKEILQYQNAVSEVYVEQNRSLCGEAIQDAFIFRTGTVSFESAISASCIVDEENLVSPMDKGKGKALSTLLSQYLNQLCASNTVLLQAHGSYSSRLYPNLEAVIQPVFLQTKQPVCSETIKTLARAWTEQLLEWRAGFCSDSFTEHEELFFELIFFTDTAQAPLLTVKKLFINGEDIILS